MKIDIISCTNFPKYLSYTTSEAQECGEDSNENDDIEETKVEDEGSHHCSNLVPSPDVDLTVRTKDWKNLPKSWSGGDPCRGKWDGIGCDNFRIITIKLSSAELIRQLSGVLVSLSEFQIL